MAWEDWAHIRTGWDPENLDLSQEERLELQQIDTIAAELMLKTVDKGLITRHGLRWPLQSTAQQLLEQMRLASTSFGFMKLPRELRDGIYELCLMLPHSREPYRPYRRIPNCAISVAVYQEEIYVAEQPALLKVSQQIREEAGSVYWGRNEWAAEFDSKYKTGGWDWWQDEDLATPRKQFGAWVSRIGLQQLRHLRDFTLGVEMCYKTGRCSPECFRLKLDEARGLQLLELPEQSHHHPDIRREIVDWHLGATELRRKRMGWKGEGIIDFFMEDDFWAKELFSYPQAYGYGKYVEEKKLGPANEWWTTA